MTRVKPMVRIAALALAALSGILAGPAAAAAPQRIVAVGDLHGDYSAWRDIARAAGLIDGSGRWAGGKTVLVQMGDITDRWADSLKIVRSLQQLQKEAPRKGGMVIVVLGNHEAMNLLGDNRYTTPGEYAAFVDGQSAARRERVYQANRAALEAAARIANPKATAEQVRAAWMAEHPLGWVEHRLAWSPSGELGKWATRNPAIARVGGTLFAHGGLSAEYARLPMEEVNRRVASAMAAGDDSPASILSDPLGPLWYRGLVTADPDAQAARAAAKPATPPLTPEQELGAVLAAYHAQRLVVAHTPGLAGIQILFGGRLARIDTGISRFYGGPLTWLEIKGDVMTAHSVARSP
ncbi:metallophosphoesterase [Sphingomonas sp.]|uniref:metallophosphoesterase n=1 Tax=Sphingomonas sp. TaxID=28214 RepID=UPI0038A0104F